MNDKRAIRGFTTRDGVHNECDCRISPQGDGFLISGTVQYADPNGPQPAWYYVKEVPFSRSYARDEIQEVDEVVGAPVRTGLLVLVVAAVLLVGGFFAVAAAQGDFSGR